MTTSKPTLAALSLLLIFGASMHQAQAQTPDTDPACPIRNAEARALTFYPAERPNISVMTYYHPVGTAFVGIEIEADGSPRNPWIVKSSGDYSLDRAAERTVLSQRFAPAIRDCVPVPATYLYEVEYN